VNIARGTFRLSIVIALVVAAYYGISGYKAAMDDEYEKQKLWTTLRCGERFLGQDMSSYARACTHKSPGTVRFRANRTSTDKAERPSLTQGGHSVTRLLLQKGNFTWKSRAL
jgi:hypothetical protein